MSAAAQPLDPKTAVGAITIRNLDSLLDQIANPELLEQGLVNIVGIAPVRDKLADRWERSRDNIYERIEKQLSRQLGAR